MYNCKQCLYFFIADCTGTVRMQFAKKENSDLVTIKKFIIKIKVGKGKIRLYNLFNGDKALGMTLSTIFLPQWFLIHSD